MTAASDQRVTDDELRDLWATYKDSGDKQARDRLIVHFSPLVKYVAGRVSIGLPSNVERSDLVGYGIMGLIDAIARFEHERGTKFETYAITRIRGAIIDELRSYDWVPRSVRAKARRVEGAYGALETRLGRAPTDHEIATELGIGDRELQQIFSQISYVGLVPLDDLGGEFEDGVAIFDPLADTQELDPTTAVEVAERRQLLVEAVGRLPERERTVVSLYYGEGLTLAEIGQVLGVSETRAWQVHTKAVLILRSRLQEA